jgi:hypothetical protein
MCTDFTNWSAAVELVSSLLEGNPAALVMAVADATCCNLTMRYIM